jgi:hypothetical protein
MKEKRCPSRDFRDVASTGVSETLLPELVDIVRELKLRLRNIFMKLGGKIEFRGLLGFVSVGCTLTGGGGERVGAG